MLITGNVNESKSESMSMSSRIVRFAAALSVLLFAAAAGLYGRNADGTDNADRGKVSKVVLDAGHGGKDPGCVYKNCLEKDVTLSIAKKLGAMIQKKYPDVEVIYTRSTDVYVPLAERGIIANKAGADLFISIHINAATNQNARGTSTHVMGMDKQGKNLEVAMRENDVVVYEDDYTTRYEGYNAGDPTSYIMFSLMQYAYQDQSMKFAEIVQKHYKQDLPMPDRGTTQEPFLVLWRTSMPSVLTEIGFLSNATDRTYVTSDKGQTEAAEALCEAFGEYKRQVESRANVVTQEKAAQLADQHDQEGILFYVQLSFLDRSLPANSRKFSSYRGKVIERRVAGKGYRYLIGGVADYQQALQLQREARKEFPDAFVVAYEGDRQLSVKTARQQTGQ